jgi:site-specific recombinase XerD
MLTIYRRHISTCPHREKGAAHGKCGCPCWCDGTVNGRRVRQSLDTVNWDRARTRAAKLEEGTAEGKPAKAFSEAVDAYIESKSKDIRKTTLDRYGRALRPLVAFAEQRGVETVDAFGLEDLDAFKSQRQVGLLTWSKELESIRQFFRFCLARKWCSENVAAQMKGPKSPQPKPRQPYTAQEITRILFAAETFGKCKYERLRAKAMLLLMRCYGFRIGDVATLRRDRVNGERIFLYASKNGNPVWAPMFADVKAALDALPLPQGARPDCPFYFWSGLGSADEHTNTVRRTLNAVFRKSGVEGAHAHRFRHTLAVEILMKGGTIEDAANALGDSPAIIRKHYLPWCSQFQNRIFSVLESVHGGMFGTLAVREEKPRVNPLESAFKLVPGVGLEPTLSLRKNGF